MRSVFVLSFLLLVCSSKASRVRHLEALSILTSLVQTSAQNVAWPTDWAEKFGKIIPISMGSYGKIYFVELKCDGTYVAVKMLSKQSRATIRREAALLRTFSDSPFFTALFKQDFLELKGFIMMEAALGGDFYNIIGKPSTTQETKLRLWYEVLEGINYMHTKQIIHRDLNPANLLLSLKCDQAYPCKAKIGDLAQACSLARPAMIEGVTVCEPRGKCGALSYCPPEIFQSSMLNAKSDVWALGLMLYELLFDRLPQPITDANTEEDLASAVSDDFIKNDNMFPRVPEALQLLLAGMLRTEIDSRLSSAEALVAARELNMGQLGLPDGFTNNGAPAKLPTCFDDENPEPKERDLDSPLLSTIAASLRDLAPPEKGVPSSDGETDYFLIQNADKSPVTSLLVNPALINVEGKVFAEKNKLQDYPWPDWLTTGSIVLEINHEPYADVHKTFTGGLHEAKAEFERRIKMKFNNKWLVKYWRPVA